MSLASPPSLPTPPLAAPPVVAVREKLGSRVVHRSKLYAMLLLLLLPTVAGVILFTYYPQISAVKYSLYRWDGQQTEEYRGLENFRRIYHDRVFWSSFQLTFILLFANLLKMWPSIFTAVVMHRLRSEKWQYIYRVLFVVPMIIPGVVGLLIWKTFYEPQGILNKSLNATGLMGVLQWADGALPRLAVAMTPVRLALDGVFGSVWGLATFGVILLLALVRFGSPAKQLATYMLLAALGWLVWVEFMGQWAYFVLWTSLGMLLPLAVLGIRGPRDVRRISRVAGWLCILTAMVVVLATMAWTTQTHAFDNSRPVWLGRPELIIPAIMFWGFPWVGTVGVLIYLAGLQAIPIDVYEAAELDGVSSAGRLFRIELPLILTQVRINLIFMTIGTLTDYGLILLLLGPMGGTEGVGTVPGLYAYRQAFLDNEYGYACALGMVMFFIILGITLLYQKLVKVDK